MADCPVGWPSISVMSRRMINLVDFSNCVNISMRKQVITFGIAK